MNQDRIRGQWKQVKGRIKEQWGRLTDDDLDVIEGKRDQLLGRIQQRHGVAKDEAQRQVRDFEERNPDVSLDDTPGRNQA
ncbi:MAG TPA: CsbD family protein [Ramlibacter sp.]|nr:CsbD family protein [Ramlibacter sp.]